jgi:hypothetical protein
MFITLYAAAVLSLVLAVLWAEWRLSDWKADNALTRVSDWRWVRYARAQNEARRAAASKTAQ